MKKTNGEVTEKQKNSYKTISVICFIVGILVILVSIFAKLNLYLIGALFFVLMLFFYLRATDHDKKIEMTRSKSAVTEDMTGHYLTRLSTEKYKVAKTENSSSQNGKPEDFQFIVIGVNGLFPIYTCNVEGNVTGNIDDSTLTVTAENGTARKINNPAINYKEQIAALASKVEKAGIKEDIVPILFFSHFRCTVDIKADESKCLAISNSHLHGENLIRAISRYKPENELIMQYQLEKIYSSLSV